MLTIFRSNSGSDIQLYDEDTTPLNKYTQLMTEIFSTTNMVILETSGGNILIRPTRVDAILVHEIEDESTQYQQVIDAEGVDSEEIMGDDATHRPKIRIVKTVEDPHVDEDMILDEDE